MTEQKVFASSGEALNTLRELVERLDAVIKSRVPLQDAVALKAWLDEGGLGLLTTPLTNIVSRRLPALTTEEQVDCTKELLDGWVPGRILGNNVYELTKVGKPADRVLKVVTDVHTASMMEAKVATTAGNLGIGPAVYGGVLCGTTYYMVMQRLSGPTLNERILTVEDVTQVLALYYRLMTEARIMHLDLHRDNIMLDGKRLYIIDYGIVDELSEEEAADVKVLTQRLHHEAISLISDLANPYGDETPEGIHERTLKWLEYTKFFENWLEQHFPTGAPQLLINTVREQNIPELELDFTVPGVKERILIQPDETT
ncbi:Hypothetical protein POVN_LOCUS179 [uncultured virus]|nr:Hypothetical protein POVN_LOCUS179 [uncultured virus]